MGTAMAAGLRGGVCSVPRAMRSLCSRNKPGSSYEDTLNLPNTDFPMRANAVVREPLIRANVLAGLYEQQRSTLRKRDGGGPAFIMHDGPPFANGPAHIGHAVNKILKDIACRYRVLRGDSVSFIPGWDCHGLPIELLAGRSVGSPQLHSSLGDAFFSDPDATAKAVRREARRIALKAIDGQREAFKQWGVMADWDNPYTTMSPKYEAAQLELFAEMYRQGLVVQGFKPVFWSPSSRTALAEAELEYQDHESRAVFVSFDLQPSEDLRRAMTAGGAPADARVTAAVWTTTPWTLPANRALAVNSAIDYVVVQLSGDISAATTATAAADARRPWLVCAAARLSHVLEKLGSTAESVVPVPASALLSSTYTRVFDGDDAGGSTPCPIVEATYVTSDAGTGVVHTAPAHGLEDFGTCERARVPVGPVLVDDGGRFTTEAGPAFAGLDVLGDGNAMVISELNRIGALLHEESYSHRYPYDWRTRKPVILRATKQWFVDLAPVASTAAAALDGVNMVPASGKARLRAMLETRNDWCISRQRSWGVPIPVFYDVDSGDALVTTETLAHVINLVATHGTDCWWNMTTEELLPPSMKESSHRYRRGRDTMDVWFDSGSSWRAAVQAREGPDAVADLVIEGSDQHRGWFQSSLLTSVVSQRAPVAPYRTVVTHGFVVDEKGRKMSKSLGNGVDPRVVIEGGKDKKRDPAYGTDLLRGWVASSGYTGDVSIGPEILKLTFEQLRRVRNTGRFLLGNLHDFDATRDSVPLKDMAQLDRFVLHALATMTAETAAAYDDFAFNHAYLAVTTLVNTHLNGFFFEAAKDRLYLEDTRGPARRSAQTAMHHALDVLTKTVAPFAVHLAEELHGFRRGVDPTKTAGASVLLEGWPQIPSEWIDHDLAARWEEIRNLRRSVFRAVEDAKTAGRIKSAAEASIELVLSADTRNMVAAACLDTAASTPRYTLEDVFLCSRVTLTDAAQCGTSTDSHVFTDESSRSGPVVVRVSQTQDSKCPRCWRFVCDASEADDMLCERCDDVLARG